MAKYKYYELYTYTIQDALIATSTIFNATTNF